MNIDVFVTVERLLLRKQMWDMNTEGQMDSVACKDYIVQCSIMSSEVRPRSIK